MVKIKFKDVTSVSFGGEEFVADENGVIEVPDEAIETLLSHGLTFEDVVVDADINDEEEKEKPALLEEAVQLGINPAKNWGVEKLKEAINKAKALLGNGGK